MKTRKVGYKEMVKNGEISATEAIYALEAEAKKNNYPFAVLRASKAYQWLNRRAN